MSVDDQELLLQPIAPRPTFSERLATVKTALAQLPDAAKVEADELQTLRQLLAQLRQQAQARGYNFFAVANHPSYPSVGAEVSSATGDPDSVIRQHMALHRDWAKQQGLADVTWQDPESSKNRLLDAALDKQALPDGVPVTFTKNAAYTWVPRSAVD